MDHGAVDPTLAANAKIAFAALCGGIVRLLFKPSSSFMRTIWLLFGCITCGYYATGPMLHWWHIGQDYAGAMGAATGFLGLSVAEAALKALDGFEIKTWIARLIGLRGGTE